MIYAAPRARSPRSVVTGAFGVLVAVGLLVTLGLALALFLYRYPPAPFIVAGFAVALLGALVLTLWSLDAAVAVGVFLLAAVRFEPAPTDLLFAVVIAVLFATGRIDFRRFPWSAGLLIGAFLTLNLVSAVDVGDPAPAAALFSIPLYVAGVGVLLPTLLTPGPSA